MVLGALLTANALMGTRAASSSSTPAAASNAAPATARTRLAGLSPGLLVTPTKNYATAPAANPSLGHRYLLVVQLTLLAARRRRAATAGPGGLLLPAQ